MARVALGLVALSALALGACDQFARVGVTGLSLDAGPRVTVDGGSLDTGPDDTPASPTSQVDAAAPTTGDAGDECARPEVAVCDPVKNLGCPAALSMQCAVDLAAPALAGYCIFNAPAVTLPCLNTLVTESCPPTSTCVSGECQKLCFCDADCGSGQCCTTPVGEHGFAACGEC